MTKQEEIKEGVQELIDKCYGASSPDYPKLIAFQPQKFLNELFPLLDRLGVVIKVDGELPSIFDSNENGISALKYKEKLAGYIKTKPLVEEEE